MLDEFLEVAYTSTTRKQAEYELVGLLKELPDMELRKIAAGTPVAAMYGHLDKTAYLGSDCGPDGQPKTFLDKFKGTPLFDQAVALEQQELQAEMTDMQKRQERRQLESADSSFYDVRDRLRVQKRLLELELAKQEAGAPAEAVPGEPVQGAGAPGPVPPEGVEAGASGVVGKTAARKVAFADALGREQARTDFAKTARAAELRSIGTVAGAVMAKSAGILSSVGSMAGKALASPTGTKAMQLALKHPGVAGGIAGAGIGAAGGAIAGGPDHRLSGALGGAALGGAAGGALGHVGGGAVRDTMSAMGHAPVFSFGGHFNPAQMQQAAGMQPRLRELAGAPTARAQQMIQSLKPATGMPSAVPTTAGLGGSLSPKV